MSANEAREERKRTDDFTHAKRRLLRIMALQRKALGFVRNVVGRDGRMVGDLLNNKVCPTTAIFVRPVAVEEPADGANVSECSASKTLGECVGHSLAQHGVQRLLLGTHGLIASRVLFSEGALRGGGEKHPMSLK